MKTKALISFAVTAKLICVFVFAYAKSRFSYDEAHIFKSKFSYYRQLLMFLDIKVAVKIWICRKFTQKYHILKIVLDFDL